MIIATMGPMALPAMAHGMSLAGFFETGAVGPAGSVAEALAHGPALAAGTDPYAPDAKGMPVLRYDAEFDDSARALTLINAGATR